MPMLTDDGFTLAELTASINEMPHVPTQLGDSGLFEYRGVSTLTVQVEKEGSTLSLVASKPRGAAGDPIGRSNRNLRPFNLVHLPLEDRLMADEVQGVRAFGTEGDLTPVQQRVNQILALGRQRYDYTLEYHRVSALKGIVYDADGSTVLHDFFAEFGVSPNTIDFELDQAGTDVRLKCDSAINSVQDELGGSSYTGMVAWCGRTFWQSFIGHKSVKETYLNQAQAAQLRGDPTDSVDFGGIRWSKYRGAANGQQMVGLNDAYIVPLGVPGLLIGRFGPADYMETVNTMGLPIYAKGIPMRNNKGWDIEMQSNPIHLLTRPRAVLKATV
jgi:hypothetical protein